MCADARLRVVCQRASTAWQRVLALTRLCGVCAGAKQWKGTAGNISEVTPEYNQRNVPYGGMADLKKCWNGRRYLREKFGRISEADMKREAEFSRILEQVKGIARQQGNRIEQEQVLEAFEELELTGEQMQMVYDYLLQNKIGIGQHLNMDDFLTEKEQDYLQTYLDEIEAYGDVSEGEKEAITLSAMAGDVDAQNRLVEIYLKEVPQIAKLYAGQGVYLEDLIGEGNVALTVGVSMLGSMEKPEEAQGMLGKMIMDAMEILIQESADAKKTDHHIEDKVNRVAEKARELREELHRKVTVQELSEMAGLSLSAIRDAIRLSGGRIEDIEDAKEP